MAKHKVELIVELATNHGGSPALAREFIDRFVEAGANTIKFQYYSVDNLRAGDPQHDWFARAWMSLDTLHEMAEYTRKQGAQFLCTAYHAKHVWAVQALGQGRIKIGSGEAHQKDIAMEIAAHPEIRALVSDGIRPVHDDYKQEKHSVMACVSRYPGPRGLASLKLQNPLYVGWSDHSIGLDECGVAIALGANIIEVHGCLRQQARPVQMLEKSPDHIKELRRMADEDPDRFIGRWNRQPH